MLDQLLSMVKEMGQEQVVNNPDVPNEMNDTVMASASESVLGVLQQAVAGGNAQSLMQMFQGQSDDEVMANPLAQQAQSGFLDSITSKLGIDSKTASGLAATFIPMIINNLVKRTNSTAPEDSGFSLEGLIGSFTGGGGGQQGGGGIGDMLQNLIGGGGGQANQGGGQDMVGNLIKGFFGK